MKTVLTKIFSIISEKCHMQEHSKWCKLCQYIKKSKTTKTTTKRVWKTDSSICVESYFRRFHAWCGIRKVSEQAPKNFHGNHYLYKSTSDIHYFDELMPNEIHLCIFYTCYEYSLHYCRIPRCSWRHTCYDIKAVFITILVAYQQTQFSRLLLWKILTASCYFLHSNIMTDQSPMDVNIIPLHRQYHIFYNMTVSLHFVLGILSNSLYCTVIIRYPQFRKSFNLFAFALSVSDLLASLISMPLVNALVNYHYQTRSVETPICKISVLAINLFKVNSTIKCSILPFRCRQRCLTLLLGQRSLFGVIFWYKHIR